MASSDHGHPWYVGVFVWLFVLTAIEVGVTKIPGMSYTTLFVVLTILAVIKAGLVAAYFMHLKFEKTRLILFVSTPAVAILLMLVVVYVDAMRIVPW